MGISFLAGRLNILEVLPADPLYERQEAEDGKVLALAVNPAGKLLSAHPGALNMLEGAGVGLTSAAFGSGGEDSLLAVGLEFPERQSHRRVKYALPGWDHQSGF